MMPAKDKHTHIAVTARRQGERMLALARDADAQAQVHLTVADFRAMAVLLTDLGNRIAEREAADQWDDVTPDGIRVWVPMSNVEARLVEKDRHIVALTAQMEQLRIRYEMKDRLVF